MLQQIFLCLILLACPLLAWQKKLKSAIKSQTPPAWMIEQIQEDLKPFKGGTLSKIVQSTVELGFKNPERYRFLHCKIQNGKFEFATQFPENPAAIEIIANLKLLASQVFLPEIEFLVSLHDCLDDFDLLGPVFAFSKDGSKHGKLILFPDFEALSGNPIFMKEVKKGVKKYPWKEKLDQAIWRGVTAGGQFTTDNFLTYPRSQLVAKSLELPELIDAKFSGCFQSDERAEILNQYSNYFSSPLPIAEHLRHKYQILIDGNSCTYSRAYWQLFSNCVIFKQVSPNIQWFYRALKPYVHYIPVSQNLEDLPERIEWAKANDRKSRKISKNAQEFARKNLTRDKVFYYVYLLLTEYAKLEKK